MKKTVKIFILFWVMILMAFICTKEETLPTNQAEGKIIQVLFNCYGSGVMIEVENPKGIGKQGDFKQVGCSCPHVNYKNAILVPSFSRIPGLNTEATDTVGTWLHFEYRKLTDEECHSNIFVDTSFHGICNTMIAPPNLPMFMINKIIDYH